MHNQSPGMSQSGLSRFAFNIYGSSNERSLSRVQERVKTASSTKLKYACDREITCISQLHVPIGGHGISGYDVQNVPTHHVLIGGKNYLKLLVLNSDQTQIAADINIIDKQGAPSVRAYASQRLFNVNTIKTQGDLIACGLHSGSISIYQVAGNGKARLSHKLDGHKRVVNSLDFADSSQVVFSGSQDGSVKLWDLRSYSQKPVVSLLASQHSDPVRSCQYSPHNRVRGKMTVLSVHDSGSLCKYDLRYPTSGYNNVAHPEKKWTFHTGPALSLHIHPELEYVLTGGRDRRICLWNYGETTLSMASPETSLSTYGPVMKLRWNEVPNAEGGSDLSGDFPANHSALYAYDFACSYLNDDPSITVYNLARKYVPKEIVTTLSKKPFQNFVWARAVPGDRKLWTITKSNAFVSYDLNSANESFQNIMRPPETLPRIVTAWNNGSAGLSVVAQEQEDYNLSLPFSTESLFEHPGRSTFEEGRTEEEKLELSSSPVSFDNTGLLHRQTHSSHPSTPTFFYKNLPMSPKTRPALVRSSTQLSQANGSLSLGIMRPNHLELGFSQKKARPPLNRNTSQTTVDSVSSGGTVYQPVYQPVFSQNSFHHTPTKEQSFSSINAAASPYVVSMSIPLPITNDDVFVALSSDYLTSVPDAFTLSVVCLHNAKVAVEVQRVRDHQTWRIISAALDNDEVAQSAEITNQLHFDTEASANHTHIDPLEEDAKSISSDLGNVVGSYNSDSTSTTNYGSVPRKRSSTSSVLGLSILGMSLESTRGEHLLRNDKSVTRHNSIGFSEGVSESPKASPLDVEEREVPPKADSADDKSQNDTKEESTESFKKPLPLKKQLHASRKKPSRAHEAPPSLSRSPGKVASIKAGFRDINRLHNMTDASHDLDNENLNILNTAYASLSSSALSTGTHVPGGTYPHRMSLVSRDSYTESWHSIGKKTLPKLYRGGYVSKPNMNEALDSVEESSMQSAVYPTSQLTKAMSGYLKEESVFAPWHATSLIRKSLEYALAQGDLVMGATMILLFYEYFQVHYTEELLAPHLCLEVLGMYIETLRARGMYTIAVQVMKDTPKGLQARLSVYAVKEVELHLYCCWCKTLLTNEASKEKYGIDGDKFGFWYCDECSRRQSNCVYCNEPCKGLTVMESLSCGHRGHFACFQEWHIGDGNDECPGGCS